jgi:branched-chain amino acid transport system substrate-binding protein
MFKRSLSISAIAISASLLLTASVFAAETVGPVTDDIGVIKIPKGAPIQIGGYWVLSGPDTPFGLDEKRGVQVAIKDQGLLLGHPIQLNAEDSLCTPEGGQTAATKLAANPYTVIVIGPSCSSEATPGAPILWKAGIVSIGTSATAPALTAANRKPEYDGFVRTAYNDTDQGREDAKWVHDVLKTTRAVTIHDGSPYTTQLVAEFVKNYQKLGGTILSQEAISPTDVDMHPLLTRIATEKPDVIYAPLFAAATGQILRQAKETQGLENVPSIGNGLLDPSTIKAAGAAVVGYKLTSVDTSAESRGKNYPALVKEYTAMFGEGPVGGFHSIAYDAAVLAFKAIEKAAVVDKNGTIYIGRKALRDAVYTIKFEGMSGPIACDAHGQCGQFKESVYEFTNADPNTFKLGVNPKKIYP